MTHFEIGTACVRCRRLINQSILAQQIAGGISVDLAPNGGLDTVQILVVDVEVPVLVPCKTKVVAVPPWAAAGLLKADSLEVKVRALLAERRQRIGYERELVAAVGACQ